MRLNPNRIVLLVVALGAWWVGTMPATAQEKGTEVELGDLKATAPESWKFGEPSNRMRVFEAKLPKAEGDKEDGELVIFFFGQGGGGGVKANLARWKDQFIPPQGKTVDDIANVEEMKVSGVPVTYLATAGTYKFKPAPFAPKFTPKPDYRMLAVILQNKQGPFFIRVTGPAKTVEKHKKAFDEWLKSLK